MNDFCLFCAIADGSVAADLVADTGPYLAFRDIAPQAPVHVLVIPREHHATMSAAVGADPALVSGLFRLATTLADDLGVSGTGYRLVVNTGAQGGQTVDHVHLHLLGQRQMLWPPG